MRTAARQQQTGKQSEKRQAALYNQCFNPLLKRGRNSIVIPGRHYKPDNISLGRTFAFISAYGVALGIMGMVWVALLLLLIDPDWPLLNQGLAALGLTAAFSSYILLAYKIFRLFGAMFGEQQK